MNNETTNTTGKATDRANTVEKEILDDLRRGDKKAAQEACDRANTAGISPQDATDHGQALAAELIEEAIVEDGDNGEDEADAEGQDDESEGGMED